jgi:predicted signal transduction protein with EAL and GGDEF domain
MDLEDSAIVAAIVSLSDTLGFVTIGEGVETTLQRDILLRLGCLRAQGYLYDRPMALADAEAALDSAARRPAPTVEAMVSGVVVERGWSGPIPGQSAPPAAELG